MTDQLKWKIFCGWLGIIAPALILGAWYLHHELSDSMHFVGLVVWPGWTLMMFDPIFSPKDATWYSHIVEGIGALTNVWLYGAIGGWAYRRFKRR